MAAVSEAMAVVVLSAVHYSICPGLSLEKGTLKRVGDVQLFVKLHPRAKK